MKNTPFSLKNFLQSPAKSWAILLASVWSLGICASANASVLAVDQMIYTDGTDLNGQTGGSGFAAAWSGGVEYDLTTPGLTYSSLEVSGNAVTWNSGVFQSFISRSFDSGVSSVSSGSIWTSFLLKPFDATRRADLTLIKGGSPLVAFGINILSSTATFQYYHSGSGPDGSGSFGSVTAGETYLLVFEHDFDDDVLNFWVNPVFGGSSPSSALYSSLGVAYANNNGVTQARFLTQLAGNATVYDELRVGSSYADVTPVPEPSVFSALLVGGLGMAVLIRRRCSK